MSVTIGALRESAPREMRVSLVPEVTDKLLKEGARLLIERTAGERAGFPDVSYKGVDWAASASEVLLRADVLLTVQPLSLEQIAQLRASAVLVGFMQPYARSAEVRALKERGVTSFAMELVPRISRAQSMDALSSQAAIGGYKVNPLGPSPDPTAEPLWVRLRQHGKKVVTATWPGADGADIAINSVVVQPATPTRVTDYTVPFGAFGGVGTTITLGLSAMARGLSDRTGLVTELPMFQGLELPEPADFVVGGHDIRETTFRESAEEFQEAIDYDPNAIEAYLALAKIHAKAGRFSDAMKVLDQSLQRRETAAGYILLAKIYLEQGKLDDAQAKVSSALRLEPSSAEANILLQQVNSKLARQ